MAKPLDTPGDVKERIDRAKAHIRDGSIKRNECLAFWRGDQYVQRTDDGYLVSQGTVVGRKPKHRPRTVRNLIHPYIEAKVSAATQRVPGYEVNATTTDPEDISAARLSEKVALYGYDKWNIRKATVKAVTSALVMDGGFAMPYWDASIGPYLETGVGIGDVRLRTFTGDEVGWEPGVDFQDSRWHVIVQARAVSDVAAMPGFLKDDKNPLTPDAQSYEILNAGQTTKAAQSKLVMVTEYLERPSAKYANGRRIVIANDRLILPIGDYPCAEYGFDGPCIHELSYTVDPTADRARGMAVHMLDAQRTYNNCTNQQISWAQLALNPQIIGPPRGERGVKFTDEPGAYFEVIPINGMTPQWRPVPPMPPELSQMKNEAKLDMMVIAAADDIPDGVDSARGIQLSLEQSRQSWQTFLVAVSEFHSRLMRHCLAIVQRYYTEPRLLSVRGRFGWEQVDDFRGADLCGQQDVTVLPGSIEPRTRQAVEQRVQWLVQMFPGFISPEAAMAAIEGGVGEKLIEGYELDVARAQLMLKKITAGPQVMFAEPLVPGGVNPVTQEPMPIPSWAPRPFDNVGVHIHIFGDYMKTPDYDMQAPPVQEALRLYYDACESLKNQAAMQAAIQQQQMAEGQGMANAGMQQVKPMPSMPKPPAGN